MKLSHGISTEHEVIATLQYNASMNYLFQSIEKSNSNLIPFKTQPVVVQPETGRSFRGAIHNRFFTKLQPVLVPFDNS